MMMVFAAVLRVSVEAALVALVVTALRTFLAKRMHSAVMRLLWLAVFVRAALPWHLPLRLPRNPQATGMDAPVLLGALPPHPGLTPAANWHPAAHVAWIWAIGMAVISMALIILYVRMGRQLRFAVPADPAKEGVLVSETLSSPVVFGILRPRIILPVGCMENPALDLILTHERIHIRRRDYLLKLFALGLVTVHWFNPVLWMAFFFWCRDMELACDEAASKGNAAAYAQALLSMAARQNGLLLGFAIGSSGVKGRIQALLLKKKPGRFAAAGAALVTMGALLCAFTGVAEPVSGTPVKGLPPLNDGEIVSPETETPQEGILSWTNSDHFAEKGFAMPLSGSVEIDSPYGQRFDGADFHVGVDFTRENIYGEPVLAVADGTVRLTVTEDHPGLGYGKYIILEHSAEITTLYAHCSAILVRDGETVKQGQPIAAVGSTGFSTKPHLHFEVRLNHNACDPIPWVSEEGRESRLKDLQQSRETEKKGDISGVVAMDAATGKTIAQWKYPTTVNIPEELQQKAQERLKAKIMDRRKALSGL